MQKKTLAAGAATLVFGAIAGINSASANNGDFSVLGTGEQVRSRILTQEPNMQLAGAEGHTGATGATGKSGEGKCGEGKCGDDKKKSGEGKCGEGKCGDDKKKSGEGKCGAHGSTK